MAAPAVELDQPRELPSVGSIINLTESHLDSDRGLGMSEAQMRKSDTEIEFPGRLDEFGRWLKKFHEPLTSSVIASGIQNDDSCELFALQFFDSPSSLRNSGRNIHRDKSDTFQTDWPNSMEEGV